MSREHTYTVNELLEFIETYFKVNPYKRSGDSLITSEYSIVDTDIEIKIQYFEKDMKVFHLCLYTFAGGWEQKRHYLIIEMDVLEKENKLDYFLYTPNTKYTDMYQLKNQGFLPTITKEEIFSKIINFFKLTCKKSEQLRDIKLLELGI